jgi:hypothetical protein
MLHQWQFSLLRGGKKHGILFWLGVWSATAVATVALILGVAFLSERRSAESSSLVVARLRPAEHPLESTPTEPPLQPLEPAAGKFPASTPPHRAEYPLASTGVASIPRLSDAERMAIRKDALEHLPAGKIAIEAPIAMKVGDKRKIDATAGLGIDAELLKNAKPGSKKYEGLLRVSAEMAATLRGPGFKIEATTPEQQPGRGIPHGVELEYRGGRRW